MTVDLSFHDRSRSDYYRPQNEPLIQRLRRVPWFVCRVLFEMPALLIYAVQGLATLCLIMVLSAALLLPASPGFWLITIPIGLTIFWLGFFVVPVFFATVATCTGTAVAFIAAPFTSGASLALGCCCGVCYLPPLFACVFAFAILALLANPVSPLFWLLTLPICMVTLLGCLYIALMSAVALLAVFGVTIFSARAMLPWGLPAIVLASISVEASIWLARHQTWCPRVQGWLMALADFHDMLFTMDTSWHKLSAALRDSAKVIGIKAREAELLYRGQRLSPWQVLQRSRMWIKALWQRMRRVISPFHTTNQAPGVSAVHSDYNMAAEYPQLFCGGWQQQLINSCNHSRPDGQARAREALRYPLADPNAPLPCWRKKTGFVQQFLELGDWGAEQRPIHLAVRKLKIGIVQELLVAGADPRIKDGTGNSAWELACKKGATGIIQMMDPQAWSLDTHRQFGSCFGMLRRQRCMLYQSARCRFQFT